MHNQTVFKSFFFIFIALLGISGLCSVQAQDSTPSMHLTRTEKEKISCDTCHYCDTPSKSKPCLLQCPRHKIEPDTDLTTPLDNGPDIVILSSLEHLYNPTKFNHFIHAKMSRMAKGCRECHHFSPEGEYPACKECHSPVVTANELHQVSLKGAYHRQCLRCHQEWSRETDCEVCHTSKIPGRKPMIPQRQKKYPVARGPEEISYKTSFLGSSTVTFNHIAHTTDYDIRCQVCHHGSGCQPCHHGIANEPQTAHRKPIGCLDCHKETNCTTCHIPEDKTVRFDHSKTRFPLSKQHARLSCRKCHKNSATHHTAPTKCSACHEKRNK